jgi:sn-glycerol 3-phosphate transport system ATP-binding protein
MIAGLETISAGEVAIGERVVNNLEPAQRDIAMVFQNYALYPHMTVRANMSYGLKIRGLARAQIEQRVRRAADILKLGDLLERKPRQLSGGQRQRVAMGRAIVREPAAFLFDEPLSNLDAKLRVQMRLEIRRLHQRLGITSVYVTHDQVEAMTLGERLIVMNEGVAEQIGPPIEIYERPRSRFVAGFIGSPAMNFLPARLAADTHAAVLPGGARLPLQEGALRAHAQRTVIVGVRPEHFSVATDAPDSALELDTTLVELLGADTLVHGSLRGGGIEMTVRLHGTCRVQAGEVLPVRVNARDVHVFDEHSGERLGDHDDAGRS